VFFFAHDPFLAWAVDLPGVAPCSAWMDEVSPFFHPPSSFWTWVLIPPFWAVLGGFPRETDLAPVETSGYWPSSSHVAFSCPMPQLLRPLLGHSRLLSWCPRVVALPFWAFAIALQCFFCPPLGSQISSCSSGASFVRSDSGSDSTLAGSSCLHIHGDFHPLSFIFGLLRSITRLFLFRP